MQFGSEPKIWDKRRRLKKERLSRLKQNGKVIPTENIVAALEAVIEPGNKVVLEGNNQKQADFLARSLCELNPDKVHDLHMIIPSMSLPEHLDVFEKGIARKLDFSYDYFSAILAQSARGGHSKLLCYILIFCAARAVDASRATSRFSSIWPQ